MKKTLITSLLALGFAAGAQAQIASYTADTSVDTLRAFGTDGYLWSDSTALITAGVGSGDDVFGGAFGDDATGGTNNQWKAGNTTTSTVDAWRLDVDFNTNNAADYGFLLKTASNPTLNAGDTFSTVITNDVGDGGDIRWLIDNNSKYYVSDVIAGVGSKNGTLAANTFSSTLSGLSWFEVDFSSPGGGTVMIPGTATSDNVLASVDGVGAFAEGVNAFGVRFASFEAVAIPEPSSFALFAGALGLGLVMLRRRRA